MPPTEPERLGDFALEKVIGKGGMGRVYLARQISLDRLVAVKVLPRETAGHDEVRRRFEKEARVAGSLTHPNVVQVYVCGVESGVPYFAMEYLDGESLKNMIAANGTIAPLESLRIAEGVTKALVCAHDHGVIHRDIKSSNIMIDRFGTVKVLDYGLAKFTMDLRFANLTRAGAFLGTPIYVSPEQARGEKVDIRTDIYSLGVVLYEMLAGKPPFEARTALDLLKKHIEEAPVPLSHLQKDIPPRVVELVDKMLAKDLEVRFASPKLLLDEIRSIIGEIEGTGEIRKPSRPRRDDFAPDRTEAVFAPIIAAISAAEKQNRGRSLIYEVRTIEELAAAAAVLLVGLLGSIAYWFLLGQAA